VEERVLPALAYHRSTLLAQQSPIRDRKEKAMTNLLAHVPTAAASLQAASIVVFKQVRTYPILVQVGASND
jgi:hypothetical protein